MATRDDTRPDAGWPQVAQEQGIVNETGQPEALLTVPQVADHHLHVSRAKVWELVHSGELRSLKIGWARRVPASAVAEFIERALAEEASRIAAGGVA